MSVLERIARFSRHDMQRIGLSATVGNPQAILEWLRDEVDRTERAVLIVYENGKVPRLIGDYGIDADIDILTTRAFLDLAERQRVVPDAETVWRRITDAASSANPAITVTLHRRPRER